MLGWECLSKLQVKPPPRHGFGVHRPRRQSAPLSPNLRAEGVQLLTIQLILAEGAVVFAASNVDARSILGVLSAEE